MDGDLSGQPHTLGGKQGGGGAQHKVQRQGGGIGDVEDQAAQSQTRNGGRGEQSQHAQSLGQAHLDGPGGGAGEQQVLQVGEHGVQGGDNGGLGQIAGGFGHDDSP